jgi:hypothetical protein
MTRSDSDEAAPYRWSVYAACTISAVVVSFVFGKEMAWDLLHYHFYSGFSALNNRFELDYFAAGPVAYFNPYVYAPFYALVKLGLPGLAVGTLMAMIHSVVLWLTYEIACAVAPPEDRRQRFFFGMCATVLAFMNPVLLQQFGSSFSDITTTAPVLGGWLLLVRAVKRPRMAWTVCAAILLGVATALKLTNALYAVAACFLVAFLPLPLAGRFRHLLCFGTALGASFALVMAPWSFRLAHKFGNPLFPLMNNVFKSPEIPTGGTTHYRFIPDSFIDALWRPFAMTGTDNMVAEELAAPDIRYALLMIVALVSALVWLMRRSGHVPPANAASTTVSAAYRPATRALAALGTAFTFTWIVWLSNSGNSRYFLPMASIAAVLAVALLFRLLADHSVGRNGILLALFLAQGMALVLGTEYRWNKAPWAGPWFNVDVPAKLAMQPNLYLTIGMQSNSFILPFLAKGSGFINIAGGYPLGPDGANAPQVRTMAARNAPHLRVLVGGDRIYPNSAFLTPRQADVDDVLGIFGLRVDVTDCETITIHGLRPMVWRPWASSVPPPITPSGEKLKYISHLASCHVEVDDRDRSEEAAARRTVDLVLDRVENACPALFPPRSIQTEHIGDVWLRVYPATDLTVWIAKGRVKFTSAVRDFSEIDVGSESAWARSPLPLQCGRRNSIYFANLNRQNP